MRQLLLEDADSARPASTLAAQVLGPLPRDLSTGRSHGVPRRALSVIACVSSVATEHHLANHLCRCCRDPTDDAQHCMRTVHGSMMATIEQHVTHASRAGDRSKQPRAMSIADEGTWLSLPGTLSHLFAVRPRRRRLAPGMGGCPADCGPRQSRLHNRRPRAGAGAGLLGPHDKRPGSPSPVMTSDAQS